MKDDLTRREILMGAGVAAASLLLGCDVAPMPQGSALKSKEMKAMSTRMPVVFLPHGGGPWPFTHEPLFGAEGSWDAMRAYMEGLSMIPPSPPKAILVVSAHWEAPVPTVMTAPKPPMLYDYYGFPPESYEVQWPAPGAPEMAAEVVSALQKAGFKTSSDGARGFDHGVFVPLKLAFPEAAIPTFQLSLKEGLDPAEHLRIGRALEPLRDKGVFIVGSGMSYHNLRAIMQHMRGGPDQLDASKAFDTWMMEAVMEKVDARERMLAEWLKAPAARACHPREEHLLPLMVCAGAAGDDVGSVPYRDVVMGAHISAAHFG